MPAATEIVSALGLGHLLVGRSHECDYPPEVAALPVVSRPRLDYSASSDAIDKDVKNLLRNGLSVFEVVPDALGDLSPDVILTQTQCKVCAVSEADVEMALADHTGGRPQIVSLEPRRLKDVWEDIGRVGEALDCRPAARRLRAAIEARVDGIARRTKDAGNSPEKVPSVATVEWIDPLMTAGNWVPELIELAGGRDLLGVPGEHSPWLQWDELAAADPHIVVVMPCGFDLQRTIEQARKLSEAPAWRTLRAVREGRAFAVDGHQYFNRPGPRLVDSLEILHCLVRGTELPPNLASSVARLG